MTVLAALERDVILTIAEALRVPVLVLTLVALAAVALELGGFAVELVRRRRRDFAGLEAAARRARDALAGTRDVAAAQWCLTPVACSSAMGRALALMIAEWGTPDGEQKIAKALADFDFGSLRRLERTRLLVRAGPALGLMGTLIPLSPALAGLAEGDVETLAENLRIAFGVTVLGLLIGAVAFGISMARDRLYGQDLSDLEYVAAVLTGEAATSRPTPTRGAAGGAPETPAAVAGAPPDGAGASPDGPGALPDDAGALWEAGG